MSDFHNYIASDMQVSIMRLQEEVEQLKEMYKKVSVAYVDMVGQRDSWKDVARGLFNGASTGTITWRSPNTASKRIYMDACVAFQELTNEESSNG